MKSQNRWFHGEIVRDILRRTGWISIIQLLLLTIALPVNFVIRSRTEDNFRTGLSNVQSLFDLNGTVQWIVAVAIPLLLALILFRYLMNQQSVSFVHSLPVSRKTFYWHHFISGIALLLMGLLISLGLLALAQLVTGQFSIFNLFDYGYWFVKTAMMMLFFFSFCTFVGMFVGNKTTHSVVAGMVLVLPAVMIGLISFMLSHYLYGFAAVDVASYQEKLFPFIAVGMPQLSIEEWLVYPVLILIFSVSGYFLHQMRASEATGNAFVFKIFQPIFKFALTFFSMLTCAWLSDATTALEIWVTLGAVLGAVLGYSIAEVMIQKTWRIFHRWKGLLIYAGVMLLLMTVIQMDITGFTAQVPSEKEVESVYVQDWLESYNREGVEDYHKGVAYTDTESINKVIRLHQQLVDEQPGREGLSDEKQQFFIVYYLKDGDKLTRYFEFPMIESLVRQHNAIIASSQRIQNKIDFFVKEVDEIDGIELYNSNSAEEESVTITGSATINGLLTALREDVVHGGVFVTENGAVWGGEEYSLVAPFESIEKELIITITFKKHAWPVETWSVSLKEAKMVADWLETRGLVK